MESFLSDLKADGAFDSGGSFTIDVSRAQMKLAEYQLARFELFPDFLVEAAIASGSASLSVSTRPNSKVASGILTSVHFRDWNLSEADLSELQTAASRQLSSRAVEGLAIALSTLSGRYPITLRSRGEANSAVVAQIYKGEITLRTETNSRQRENTTTLQIPLDLTPEFTESFRKRAAWTSTRLILNKSVFINSKSLPARLNGLEGFLFSENCPALLLTPQDREGNPAFLGPEEQNHDSKSSYFLALTTPEEAEKMGLVFWRDGSIYPILPEIRKLGVCGFLSVPHLKRDLSYSALLNNQEYQQALETARRLIALLLEKRFSLEKPMASRVYGLSHLLVSELEPHLEVKNLWRGLADCAVDLEPATDRQSWDRLEEQLSQATPESVSRLWTRYRDLVRGYRSAGNLTKAQEYQAQKCECLKLLRLESPGSLAALACLQYLSETHKPERYELSPTLAEYLSTLETWQSSSLPQFSEEVLKDAHPSWIWPFALHRALYLRDWSGLESIQSGPLPAWLECLRHFQQERMTQGLQLLENTPELRFQSESLRWHEYLCYCHSGRSNFAQAVRFRVRLSLELVKEVGWASELPDRILRSLLYSTGLASDDIVKRANKCVDLVLFQTNFWPDLFFLTRTFIRYPEWVSWRFWRRISLQSILGSLLEHPEDDPLATPFLSEIPGAWSY